MPPVGSAGPLLIWLSAELPGSPPELFSVSEPDGEPDLLPPTWTEPEASSGPVRTGTVWTGFDGSDFVGIGFVGKGFDGTGLVGSETGFVGTWILVTGIGSGLVGRDFVGTEAGFVGTDGGLIQVW